MNMSGKFCAVSKFGIKIIVKFRTKKKKKKSSPSKTLFENTKFYLILQNNLPFTPNDIKSIK